MMQDGLLQSSTGAVDTGHQSPSWKNSRFSKHGSFTQAWLFAKTKQPFTKGRSGSQVYI